MNIEQINLLQKVTTRRTSVAIHFKYLKYLFNDIETVDNIDKFSNKNFITLAKGIETPMDFSFDNESLEVVLNILSDKLFVADKIAVRIYQNGNGFYVETN
jgi:hypothetical protein